jgi:hypothetical protein
MSYPRIVLAGLAVWVASIAVGYVINDMWLVRLYQANAWAYRRPDDIMPLLPVGFAAQLLGCFAFAFAYAKGYERNGSGLGQGIRFGLVIAILIDGFATVWNLVSQPIAVRLGVLEMVSRIGEFGVYGAIVGLIYQPGKPTLPQGVSEQYDLRG